MLNAQEWNKHRGEGRFLPVLFLTVFILGAFLWVNRQPLDLGEVPVHSPFLGMDRATLGKVDINTASARALMHLSGIGETLAQRIIDYRTANGDFGDVRELLNVEGIGEAKLAAIADAVCVSAAN